MIGYWLTGAGLVMTALTLYLGVKYPPDASTTKRQAAMVMGSGLTGIALLLTGAATLPAGVCS